MSETQTLEEVYEGTFEEFFMRYLARIEKARTKFLSELGSAKPVSEENKNAEEWSRNERNQADDWAVYHGNR
jgi:hypothetical protein